MTTTIVYIGDTITFKGIFENVSGSPVDPDSNIATVTVYKNENLSVVGSPASATKQSVGTYTYNWLVPPGDGTVYILEMKGLFNTEPQLKRLKVKAKFRP